MPYIVQRTPLSEVLVLEPTVYSDGRGFFFESFNQREFENATGLDRQFVQDNHSRSSRGVLRGLHYQISHAQGKLVRVTVGEVFDVVVDMRTRSPTFGRHVSVVLSAENKRQVWIPEGFAHGYHVTSDVAEFLYKATDYWYPEHERSLLWSDASLGIHWPLQGPPLLAPKDESAPSLEVAECFD